MNSYQPSDRLNATQAAGFHQYRVVHLAQSARRQSAQRKRDHKQLALQPKRTTYVRPHALRRHWRGCVLSLIALTLIIGGCGILAYVLLSIPSPTNILILGVDRRPDEGNTVRTDTLLLMQADPGSHRLVLLSIPRDLWVTLPGRGEDRINTAHFYGELETPGNGPIKAAETVTYNFNVPVHRVLRLDFDAFREVVDAAGGIEIDVPTAVIDNAYPTDDYGTVRIEIPAGKQHMDGETALQYARSRHGSSDFDRAKRQQQILMSLVKKLTRPNGWLLIPNVYQAFRSATDTDLTLRDLVRLISAWKMSGEQGLQTFVIDRTMTTPYRTPQGAAVLLPRWEVIHPLIQAEFAP